MRILIPVVLGCALMTGCDDAREELVLLSRDVYALQTEVQDVGVSAGKDLDSGQELLERLKASTDQLTARVDSLQTRVEELSPENRTAALARLDTSLDDLARELAGLRGSLAVTSQRIDGLQNDLDAVERVATEAPASAELVR